MSRDTSNSRFQRKTGKKGDSSPKKPRSYGMRSHGASGKPRSPRKSNKGRGREGGSSLIWGAHAATAALANPKRTIHAIYLAEAAQNRYDLPTGSVPPKVMSAQELDRMLPDNASHQGIALKAAPLEWPHFETLAEEEGDGLILVLDQITDPHNVGAMLRLCSAFNVSALVMQTRNAPPLFGATAKVAVGCLETVPVCLVTNIANSLKFAQKSGWIVTGLAGETDLLLSDGLPGAKRQVIVMGAEGPGLRPRVRDHCDQLVKIPMLSSAVPGQAESLNVATAAAIALYEARRD